MSAEVSVVIAAKNARGTIDAQLEALGAQTFQGNIEIVVADNASTDDTLARVLAWSGRIPGLRTVDASAVPGAAHARNAAIRVAAHELVAVCDADDIVDREWLARLVKALTNDDLVAGGVVPWNGGARPQHPEPVALNKAGFGFLPVVTTASLAFHRAVWEELDGFDESLPAGEDIDFAWRAQLAGHRLVQRPDAFVYYRASESPAEAFRKGFSYGKCQPTLYSRYRAAGLPRQRIHRAIGRWLVLAATVYHLRSRSPRRREWSAEAGRRLGRLVGSLRMRVIYL